MILVLENTLYSILIYLILNSEKKETYFILEGVRVNKQVINKLNKYYIKCECYEFGQNKKTKKLRIIFHWIDFCSFIFKALKTKKLKLVNQIYGNDNLFIYSFFKKKQINLLDDGIVNYNIENWSRKKSLILRGMNPFYIPYGKEKNVRKVYLTGLAPIPKEIAHKVEIINLKESWNKKALEEQNKILDIFSFDLNIKETIKGRDIILFTQPLSEDGVITEEEKINIYSNIIKKYPQDRLIIKTHPREKTNYKEMFKDNLVLDNPFPFEILNLLDVKFKKAVTLFSTAALGLGEGVEIDFYGTEVNNKILARFGSCDNIMKRNSYLEEEE